MNFAPEKTTSPFKDIVPLSSNITLCCSLNIDYHSLKHKKSNCDKINKRNIHASEKYLSIRAENVLRLSRWTFPKVYRPNCASLWLLLML